MNQTDCPEGWATDTILWFDNPNKCDMTVSSWIAIGVLSTAARAFIGVGQLHLWIRRESKQKSSKDINAKHRLIFGMKFPLVLILSLIQAVLMVIFFVLTATDIANGPNGMSSFIYGLIKLKIATNCILYYTKFVRLGHRLIGNKNSKWVASKLEGRHLSTFDFRGKMILIVTCLTATGYVLAFLVFGAAFPNQIIIVTIGNAFIGGFMIFNATGQINHIQRVKNAIRSVIESSDGHSPNSVNDLRLVERKLFEQQLAMLAPGVILGSLAFLVTARVLMPNFYMLMVYMWGEMFAEALVLASNYRYIFIRHRRTQGLSSRSDGGGPKGVDGNKPATSSMRLAVSPPSDS